MKNMTLPNWAEKAAKNYDLTLHPSFFLLWWRFGWPKFFPWRSFTLIILVKRFFFAKASVSISKVSWARLCRLCAACLSDLLLQRLSRTKNAIFVLAKKTHFRTLRATFTNSISHFIQNSHFFSKFTFSPNSHFFPNLHFFQIHIFSNHIFFQN